MAGCELGESVILNGMPNVMIKRGGKIVLRDRVTVNSSQWSNPLNVKGAMSLFAGPQGKLVMEEGSGVSGSQIIANVGVYIGSDSMIGAGSLICDSDMHEVPLKSGRDVRMEPIRIGQRVFIGARCIIMKGVTIGDGAVVGAGSVVVSDVPADSVYAGNPGRCVKRFRKNEE